VEGHGGFSRARHQTLRTLDEQKANSYNEYEAGAFIHRRKLTSRLILLLVISRDL